jgi:hypothetical protein
VTNPSIVSLNIIYELFSLYFKFFFVENIFISKSTRLEYSLHICIEFKLNSTEYINTFFEKI